MSKMRWLLVPVAFLFASANAIFTDDAFHIDYHQALLGFPVPHNTLFHKPRSSSNASLLFTISDKAVLGAVNPRDGSLVWRQALAGQPLDNAGATFLVAGDQNGRITSAYQSSISAWDALDGRLIWSLDLGAGSLVEGLQAVPTIAQESENVVEDVVVLTNPSEAGPGISILRLAGEGPSVRWEYQDKSVNSETYCSIATSPKYVYYISRSSGILSSGKAKVVVIDLVTGKEVSQYNVAVDSESLGFTSSPIEGSGSESPFIVTTQKPYKSVKFNLLGTNKVSTLTLDEKDEEINRLMVHAVSGPGSSPHFLIHIEGKTKHWAEVFHINKKTGDVARAYSLPAISELGVFAATSIGSAVYFTWMTESGGTVYTSGSDIHVRRWTRSGHNFPQMAGNVFATTEVSVRDGELVAFRVALSSSTTGWGLVRNGEQLWHRPEMLAYITNAVWMNDVEATALAQEIAVEATSNPFSAYLHRLTRHLQGLKHLPQYLAGIPQSILQSGDDTGKSTRERLAGSKLVLASTSRGEVLALDATDAGNVRWIKHVGSGEIVHLAVSEGRLTVYLASGEFVVLDVASSETLEQLKFSTPFHEIIELPGQPASTTVRVDKFGKPEVFSELAPATPMEGNVVMTINDKGEAIGWSVGTSVEQIWTLRPENGAKINSIVGRPLHDPIASIGQTLGDRSVLYKYISPNVALLTALSPAALTVYIINAITGSIIYTSSHAGVLVELPITAAMSGNKIVYSFTTQDPINAGLSTQVIVSELYESEVPDDRGLLSAKSNYSSFSPDAGAKPYVQSRAFTVAEPLSNLTITQTAQGITSRQIVGYLAGSQSLVGIPSDALNARRPIDRDPTATEMEEGLVRYSPILDLDPKFFLSHSRDVMGIRKIMAAPTLLESTSLVFATGHDVFGTQIAPSNTFDVLGKSFKRIQLVLTVIALYVGVLLLRPVVRKKMVERHWT